jgi:hypothetical protein
MLVSRRVLDVAYRLDGLVHRPEPAAEPVPIESLGYDIAAESKAELPVVPIESLAPDEVVPIESLAPDEVVPIESLAPDTQPSGGIEGSFRTFELLLRARGTQPPSLDALIAAAPTAAVSTAAVSTAAVPAAAVPAAAPPEPQPVAIGTLCYRGQAALERASVVRHQINAELTRDASIESLQPLLQELLDLVPLALERS